MKVQIIGGGIVGLCSAWFLQRAGAEVVVIEKNDLSDGTSFGNAGLIVPSHFVPLASPGTMSKALKWIFNPKSPFALNPRLSPELVKWLWHFYRSSTSENVARASGVLRDFHELSKELYRQFHEIGHFQFDFEEKGLLMVYRTAEGEKEEKNAAELATKIGIEAYSLHPDNIRNLAKGARASIRGGILYPGDAHLNPGLFMRQITAHLESSGVRFIVNTSVSSFEKSNSQINALILSDGKRIIAEEVILAAGSWSAMLGRKLRLNLLVQSGKGYSMTLPKPESAPTLPCLLSEAKVAITPMGPHLRIGGTLEIGNMTNRVNKNRVKGILESVNRYMPGLLQNPPDINQVWQGYRPCTPDGLPFIGRVSGYSNLTVAAGHAMLGMSLGPATGLVVSEIISGKEPSIDLSLFAPERFG